MKPYYDEAGITIYHGDCREILPVVPAPAAIITDPPYGIGLGYDEFDDRDGPAYWSWMDEWLTIARAVQPRVMFTHRVAALRHLNGWDWVGVWNKPMAMSGLIQLPIMPHWEPVFLYGIKGRGVLPRGVDVFTHQPAFGHGIAHPAVKPVGLYIELITRFALDGPVLDPFAGSGTTLRAAKDLGIPAVGIELSERYCEIAARRLAQEVLDFGGAA